MSVFRSQGKMTGIFFLAMYNLSVGLHMAWFPPNTRLPFQDEASHQPVLAARLDHVQVGGHGIVYPLRDRGSSSGSVLSG